MARMSIDDMVSRDTRIDRLARLCGWSRRETRSCLEDVWAICYDRVVPYLPADDIEVTAARDAISPPAYPEGFVAALRVVGLARDAVAADRFYLRKDGSKLPWPDQQWRDRIYLHGAAERVGYPLVKKTAGHEGGVKSGKSRRSKAKQSFTSASSKDEAEGKVETSNGNPPDLVPDLPMGPAHFSDSLSVLPDGFQPEVTTELAGALMVAERKFLDMDIELAKFTAHAHSFNWKRADWTSAFAKWLLDAKPASAAERTANAQWRKKNERAVARATEPNAVKNIAPLTTAELAELQQMTQAAAMNPAAAAAALRATENAERREGSTRGVLDNHPRMPAKEATG